MLCRIVQEMNSPNRDGQFKVQVFYGFKGLGLWLTHDVYVDYRSPRRFRTAAAAEKYIRECFTSKPAIVELVVKTIKV